METLGDGVGHAKFLRVSNIRGDHIGGAGHRGAGGSQEIEPGNEDGRKDADDPQHHDHLHQGHSQGPPIITLSLVTGGVPFPGEE